MFTTRPLSLSERRRTMIKLLVEDYCHECSEFEPVKVGGRAYLDIDGNVVYLEDIKVMCEHDARCHRIKKHLEENRDT